MSRFPSLLLGGLLVLGGFVLAGSLHPAKAVSGGPYVLERHSNPNANAGVFRLDTSSGGVSYCYLTGGSADITCTREVQ